MERVTLERNTGICSGALGTQRGVGIHSSLAESRSVMSTIWKIFANRSLVRFTPAFLVSSIVNFNSGLSTEDRSI